MAPGHSLPTSSGVGRTGAFCLMYAAVQEVEAGNSIPDLARLVKRMRQQRKHMLQEKVTSWEGGGARQRARQCPDALRRAESALAVPGAWAFVSFWLKGPRRLLLFQLHLKFCYEAVLKHAEQVLQRHGVTTPAPSKAPSSAAQKVGTRAPRRWQSGALETPPAGSACLAPGSAASAMAPGLALAADPR